MFLDFFTNLDFSFPPQVRFHHQSAVMCEFPLFLENLVVLLFLSCLKVISGVKTMLYMFLRRS